VPVNLYVWRDLVRDHTPGDHGGRDVVCVVAASVEEARVKLNQRRRGDGSWDDELTRLANHAEPEVAEDGIALLAYYE
jgi:hypothetical protein